MKYILLFAVALTSVAHSYEVLELYESGNPKKATIKGLNIEFSDSRGETCTNAIVLNGTSNEIEDKYAAYVWTRDRIGKGVSSVILSGASSGGWVTYYEFKLEDGAIKTLCFKRPTELSGDN